MQVEYRRDSKKQLITEFTGTPEHTGSDGDIICPHFWQLKYATGCPYDCAWCYLKKTLRHIGTDPIIYKTGADLERETRKWLESTEEPSVLNAGELADSLAIPSFKTDLIYIVFPLFAKQTKHTLLLLTKTGDVEDILKLAKSLPQVIISFTINAPYISDKYEKLAPPSLHRIEAARTLALRGWRVRVRVDPLIPEGAPLAQLFKENYAELATMLNIVPWERVTLGSLRGLPGLPRYAPSDVWKYADSRDGADNRWRVSQVTRELMYAYMTNWLTCENIALCKETRGVWKDLGLNPELPGCNCAM